MRGRAAAACAIASAAIFVASVLSAWATFDFWEALPLTASVVGVGLFAGVAAYLPRHQAAFATIVGVLASAATFVTTLFITLARWSA